MSEKWQELSCVFSTCVYLCAQINYNFVLADNKNCVYLPESVRFYVSVFAFTRNSKLKSNAFCVSLYVCIYLGVWN